MAVQGGGDKVHLGRVLVVDDDVAIRRVCARVLKSEGHRRKGSMNGTLLATR